MDKIPTFETQRLHLRTPTYSDVPSYEKHFVDYNVIAPLSAAVPWPYPKTGVRDFLDLMIFPNLGKDQWLWGLFEKQNSSELIGCVHLWRKGRPENRGFWLGKKYWGKGYMAEAVEPITEYAFTTLGFEKLTFANALGNIQSRRIKEKTGAQLIGLKPASFVDPKYTQHEIWELTKSEWQARKELK